MRSLFSFLALITLTIQGGTSHAQHLFEFCDDFCKPACRQRNPWAERIETERHDFTQSAVTVGRGVTQLEAGYSYYYKDDGELIESSHTGPEILLRYGISEDIELRLRWNYAWKFIKDEPDEMGAEDLRYGVKLQMSRGECDEWIPTSALEIRGTAPTGGEPFTTDAIEFNLDYIYQWWLTEKMTLAGSTGFGTNGFGDFGLVPPEESTGEEFTFMTQSAVVGLELSEMNTLYTEWYGIFTDGLTEEINLSFVNIGIDHYITEHLVIDLRLGFGLTRQSDDLFSGIGGGYRF